MFIVLRDAPGRRAFALQHWKIGESLSFALSFEGGKRVHHADE